MTCTHHDAMITGTLLFLQKELHTNCCNIDGAYSPYLFHTIAMSKANYMAQANAKANILFIASKITIDHDNHGHFTHNAVK